MRHGRAEQLLEIAEIGAAFAGFTGVIGALGRAPGKTALITRINFWFMIEFSVATIFFALIPFAVYNFTAPEETPVWVIASAILALFIVVHLWVVYTRVRPMVSDTLTRNRSTRWAPRIVLPLFVVVLAIQTLNALGLGFDRSYAGCFLGLLLFLFLAALNFIGLMQALWPGAEAD